MKIPNTPGDTSPDTKANAVTEPKPTEPTAPIEQDFGLPTTEQLAMLAATLAGNSIGNADGLIATAAQDFGTGKRRSETTSKAFVIAEAAFALWLAARHKVTRETGEARMRAAKESDADAFYENPKVPTPPSFPVPLTAARGKFSFLRDVVKGKTKSIQSKLFSDFLRHDILRQKAMETWLPAKPVLESDVTEARDSWGRVGFEFVEYHSMATTFVVWNEARLKNSSVAKASNAAKAKHKKAAADKSEPQEKKSKKI